MENRPEQIEIPDDWETIWQDIIAVGDDRIRSDEIPPSLENYLLFVTKSGNTIFPWHNVRCLFRLKLLWAIEEFGGAPLDNERHVLRCFDSFCSAPFTIQRFTELIIEPRRHYRIKEKFLRAVEKTVKVISTVEPEAIAWGQNIKKEIEDNEENNFDKEHGQGLSPEDEQNDCENIKEGVSGDKLEKSLPGVNLCVTKEKTPRISKSTLKKKTCSHVQNMPNPCICILCDKPQSSSGKLLSTGRIHSG